VKGSERSELRNVALDDKPDSPLVVSPPARAGSRAKEGIVHGYIRF